MTTRLDYWDNDSDRQRLLEQARRAREVTERLLRRAGIGPGMRVLDVGTGMGDVAFIAAELVGPSGYVLGVDQLGASIEGARARGLEAGAGHVEFEVADFHDLAPAELFDAAVGRYVLQYQQDPGESLRCIATSVRSGGVLAFSEMSSFFPVGVPNNRGWPPSDTFDAAASFQASVGLARGMWPIGQRLMSLMIAAGLEPSGDLEGSVTVRVGPPTQYATMLRNALDDAAKLGITVPADLRVEEFPERVVAEVAPEPFLWSSPLTLSVWARKP